MKKKNYIQPSMKVHKFKPAIICGSGLDNASITPAEEGESLGDPTTVDGKTGYFGD